MSNGLYNKTIVFLAIFLAFFVFNNSACLAQTAAQNALQGLEQSSNKAYGTLPTDDVPTTIGKIVGVVLSFVGVLFLFLLVYGGFGWMLAKGNQQEVQKAKDLIEAAVFGLILILAAYALTSFIGTVFAN